MELEELRGFLETEGVDFKEAGQRIYLKHCFECGNDKWKATFRERSEEEKKYKVLWGKCFRCDTTFSSYRYLIELGFTPESVKRLHRFDDLSTENASAEFIDLLDEEERRREAQPSKEEYVPKGVSIEGMFSIGGWSDHPAALYAKKRGVPPELHRHVMIDPTSNSVVFLCWEGEKLVGWQKRFVNPPTKNFKTMNPPADQFKKSMHVIEYENSGPIAICEGPFTGIAAWLMGYHAIVTFGSGVSKAQMSRIEEIVKRTGKSVFVSFDLDPAGFRGYFKIKNYFERRGVDVKRIQPEEGNDLNDSWQAGRGARVIEQDTYDSTVPVLDLFPNIYGG